MEQLIKDQCERNREIYERENKKDNVNIYAVLDEATQQTAEEILSAVRAMVEKQKAFRKQETNERNTKYFTRLSQHRDTLDDLLTQLQANNKDV